MFGFRRISLRQSEIYWFIDCPRFRRHFVIFRVPQVCDANAPQLRTFLVNRLLYLAECIAMIVKIILQEIHCDLQLITWIGFQHSLKKE